MTANTVDLLQQDEVGTRAEVFPKPESDFESYPPPSSNAASIVPALRKRLAATIGKASPGLRLLQAALLIDQSRRFTGAQTWVSPWVALPVVALLFAFQSLPAADHYRHVSTFNWLLAILAAVAMYWPLGSWSLGLLLGCAACSYVVPLAQRLQLTAGAHFVNRKRWISLPKLTAVLWGAYIWCLIVQPPPTITLVATMLLPLPAAWVLAGWLWPRQAVMRLALVGVLMLLIPALPGAITGGRLVPLGFYSLFGLVAVADLLALASAQQESKLDPDKAFMGLSGTRSGWISVLAIAGMGTGLRLAALWSRSLPLGPDQFQYYDFAQSISSTGITTAARPLYMLGASAFGTAPLSGVYLSYLQQLSGVQLFPSASIVIVFAGLLQILAIAAFGQAVSRRREVGIIAGFLWAILPVTLDMQSWFGLANAFALTFIPIALLALYFYWEEGSVRCLVGLTIAAAALVLTHPLSAVFAGAAGALVLAALLWRSARLRQVPVKRLCSLLACSAIVLTVTAPDVYLRYLSRGRFFSADWKQYLASRPDAHYLGWLLSIPLVCLAGMAVFAAIHGRRRTVGKRLNVGSPPRPLLASSLTAGSLLLLFAWVVGVEFPYGRAPIFLAAGLVPFAAWAIWRWSFWNLRSSLLVAAVFVAPQAGQIIQSDQKFFQYPTTGSVQALEWIRENSAPNAVLAVQQCQFASASYLARRPTMPAMLATMLSSSSEYPVTQAALRIFHGTPGYEQDLQNYHVSMVLLDRGCNVAGAVQSEGQLIHLLNLPRPFHPVFDNGDMLVLERP